METKKIIVAAWILFFSVSCGSHRRSKSTHMQSMNVQNMSMQSMNMPGMNMNSSQKQTMKPTQGVIISPAQQLLGNIHTDTATSGALSDQLVLTGMTIANPEKQQVVSTRASGWIEKLYVKDPGEEITAGQKLYDLYSPEILSAERDYLLALKQSQLMGNSAGSLSITLQAMHQKLIRFGLSEAQIEKFSSESLTKYVTIYSKVSGYLLQKIKTEGDYVDEGDAVLEVSQNNTLWVRAQLYDNELSLIREQPAITVKIGAFPDKKFTGSLAFTNPANVNNSRVHLINMIIPNPAGQIQPGMLAYVYLKTDLGRPSVMIPASSIIYDQDKSYVWVEDSTSRFERRSVLLGDGNKGMISILSGLNRGEIVVSSGALLVNSEYILKYGSGVNLSGMQMSDMKMKGRGQ